jgi:integral membrane protein
VVTFAENQDKLMNKKKLSGMGLSFSNSAIGRLRMTGIAEGFSFITLLFIAMPLKYIAGDPRLVLYVGWVHGLLFMLYILALITVKINLEWKFKKTLLSFLASLVPFGTFIMDKSWRKEEREWIAESEE